MIRAGVLSDSHLYECSDLFQQQVAQAFADCDVIIHAGDLCTLAVLRAFGEREVYAVCGNMCDFTSQQGLPVSRSFTLDKAVIGLCHGAGGPRHNIEERVWALFPDAHCIIYGHSHQPVCHRQGGVLFLNPGSFLGTGPYGAPGSYAILEIDGRELRASLHQLPQP